VQRWGLPGVDRTLSQALAIDGMVVGLRTFGFMVPAAAGVREVSYMLAAVGDARYALLRLR